MQRVRAIQATRKRKRTDVRVIGRNGGHLTSVVHGGFKARAALFGAEDALREIALQQYNVAELLNIITANGHVAEVDLVSGGHVELFFTEQEYINSRADFAAAEKAGVDVRCVEWLSEEDVQTVSRS